MKYAPLFKFITAIALVFTFTACADYLSDNNTNTGNLKIGLPGGVNVVNSEINNAKSRSIVADIPNIHNSLVMGAENPLFCRYTTTPGMITRKNSNKTSTIANTRGVAITTNSFYDSYSLYCYVYPSDRTWAATTQIVGKRFDETYFDEEVEKSTSWTTNEFWPSGQEKCAFFAYAPYHAKGLSRFSTGGWPTFHYSVPTEVSDQNDLLVTKNEIPANANAYGNIDISGGFNKPDSITFDHACTAIRFAIGDQMAPGVIKKIKINNVYGTGDYNYETESWSNIDSLKTFTLTQDFEIKPGEHNKILNDNNNVFMMIPQKLPSDATMEITINDGSERIIKGYLRNDEWKKGYTVTYYLSTAKVESSYVISISPDAGNIACAGGTKAITINSYKKTYYGTQIAVPWTASYTYDDADEIGTTSYNTSTAVVPGFAVSGNGSTTGESVNFQAASQIPKSKSWRSTHTKKLREATDGSCNLATGKQTANCYIIQAPGTYTFPLVYGNALNANGSPNSNSYSASTFVDHNGVQIDNPYIYTTNSGANVPYDACIVWQDAPHLVTPSSVQLTSDKHSIQFTIERKNICAGNCVIAVRDKDKNIMWSWQIWVTDHDMTHTYEVHNNSSVGGEVISNFMEVPQGWCDAEVRIYDPRTFHITVKQTETGGQTATANVVQLNTDSTYTYGVNAPFYQWGRKDALLASNGMGTIDKPYYDNLYNWQRTLGAQSTANVIRNPFTFYFTQDGDWSSSHNYDYWNKNFTNAVGLVNTATIKTIYDPAISGFVAPKTAAFTGFTSNGYNTSNSGMLNVYGSYNLGYYIYSLGWQTGNTVFFDTLGVRDIYSGRGATGGLIEVGASGCYQVVGATSTANSISLLIQPGRIYTDQECGRSYGMTYRPVLE